MAKQDYYATLEIDRKAGAEEIKKSYRKLAMQCHPDRNPGDKDAERRFKELNEAYDVLKDGQKRAAYDRFGHAAFEGGAGSGFGGFGTGFASGFADIFDEMFGDFVQGGRRTSGVMQGADLRYNLQITLEESFQGKKTSLRIPTAVPCDSCRGTGSAGGTAPVTCATCHGQGRVRSQSGFFTVERTCPNCQGAGQIIRNPCRSCAGAGRVQREKTLSVQIPAGVEDGTRIRLAGEGEAGLRGGPPGDLYIFIAIALHRIFQREGANIHCRVPIPMTTAVLGGTIAIPTVEGGRAQLTIPAGTPTGHQFRIKNKGMTVLHSKSRGDMFVHAIVETPVSLTKRQQELLREFEREGNQATHSPQSHGFFHKMKELWEDLKE